MLQAKNITKSYGKVDVLKGINLEIKKGEIVAIVGSSGAGKTTLLNILGTLDKPSGGELLFNANNVFQFNEKQLSNFRNVNLGFVFQFHQLLAEFTAVENVMLPALIGQKNKKESLALAEELLNDLGLNHRLNHKPSELSGGEKQRVAVARALINNPDIILADEPTGNLDSNNRNDLHELFGILKEKYNQTIVIVSHDETVSRIASRTLHIKDGVIDKIS